MAIGDQSAARRYAEAVFELAGTENRLDEWNDELSLLAAVFGDPSTMAWLANPGPPAAQKDALIQRALESSSDEARNLARLLVARGRAALAGPILAAYQAQLDATRGIVHALVTTAVPLSDADRSAVAQRLTAMTGQEVKMETTIDPAIIGGIVVRIGDKLIDGSTRARLIELKRRLAGTGS
jgi:F-type H+-transporting ATPase subunit delta